MVVTYFLTLLIVFSKGVDWNYDESSGKGPSAWSTLYEECGGDRQTPIDILTDGTIEIEDLDYREKCLKSNYINIQFSHSTFKIWNNGHGFTVAAVDSEGDFLRSNTTTIGRLKNTFDDDDTMYHNEYCLDSFHFHFGPNISVGSEHYINGKQYPIEAHFVFYSCNYEDITAALTAYVDGSADVDSDTQSDTNVLAVVGTFFNVHENNDLDNAAFTQISAIVDDVLTKEDDAQTISIDVSGFFGGSDALDDFINSIYIYEGSLTTPPCLEAVLWHVSTTILHISQAQLEALYVLTYENSTTTIGDFGNFRPLQNVNDRELYEQQCKSNGFKVSIIYNYMVITSILFVLVSFI